MPVPPIVLPTVIGHRGAAALAPENTLAAVRSAAAAGATWVECDLRITRDRRLVVCHDATLDRTTDGRGRVSDRTLDEIGTLDAGRWFDPAFAGEPVPDIASLLSLCGSLGMGINFDIKVSVEPHDLIVEAVAEAVEALPEPRPPLLLSCFNARCLDGFRRRLPDIPRGYLSDRLPPDWRAHAEALECSTVHCRHTTLSPHVVEEVRGAGFALAAFTLPCLADGRHLLAWGVDALFLDDPRLDAVGTAGAARRR